MRYRERLPQLEGDRLFLTDGGIETTLIFHQGLDLPEFAAFVLLEDDSGVEALRSYFRPYLEIAREQGAGFVLDTATWRANPDWAAKLGYSAEQLDEVNRRAVALAEELREEAESETTPIVIDGVVGPRGDGYDPGEMMSADEAERYHSEQIGTFSDTAADMVSAITMTYPEEAIGLARAARAASMPVVISFTVETDGRLPTEQPLKQAVEQVDAETDRAPAYYMINCAHPQHFAGVLEENGGWIDRIAGLRANASTQSHAELDEAEELDEGDPVELGAKHAELKPRLRSVNVLGGCCGTDSRHVGQVCSAWRSSG
jgi:S-methylmethionine-dependent homocysteine/selenocysteine methylase